MRKSSLIAIMTVTFMMFIGNITAQTKNHEADKVIGTYWSPKKDAKIIIYKKGNLYYGKSTWVAESRKDNKNPDKKLQLRDIQGIELLSRFSYDDGTYTNGTIYDPESGTTYRCKMTIEGKQLKVRGYIGISLFGRTEFFERIM